MRDLTAKARTALVSSRQKAKGTEAQRKPEMKTRSDAVKRNDEMISADELAAGKKKGKKGK
jgi:hypothetical protein